MPFVLCTLHVYYINRLLNYVSIEQWGLVCGFSIILLAKFSVLRKKVVLHFHLFNTKLYPFQNLSLGFILKIFLKFRKFQPRYSYKIYSYRKKRCTGNWTTADHLYHAFRSLSVNEHELPLKT